MNKFIMVIGLPASGKDTYIKNFLRNTDEDFIHLSSDNIREELYGDAAIQGPPAEVFNLMNKRLKNSLILNKNIIYNATNIKVKDRQTALKEVKKYKDYMCYAIIIGTIYNQCLINNRKRRNEGGRFVPEEVIKRMYYSFEPPHTFEGFNKIEVFYPFVPPYRDCKKEIKELKKVSHDCEPYHKYTIGTHINRAAKMAKADIKKGKLDNLFFDNYSDYYKNILPIVLYMHDLGKAETKVFTDAKGNPSKNAHYYHHENVGAYNYMFYNFDNDKDFDIVKYRYDYNIAAAIAYHMRPYQWDSEKTEEKYKKLWGIHLFNLIKAVHIYDKKSEED